MNTIQSKSIQITDNNGKISKNINEMIYNQDTGRGIINNNGKIYKFQKKPNNNDIALIFSQKPNQNDLKNDLQTILRNKNTYTPLFPLKKKQKRKKKSKQRRITQGKNKKKKSKTKKLMKKVKKFFRM